MIKISAAGISKGSLFLERALAEYSFPTEDVENIYEAFKREAIGFHHLDNDRCETHFYIIADQMTLDEKLSFVKLFKIIKNAVAFSMNDGEQEI